MDEEEDVIWLKLVEDEEEEEEPPPPLKKASKSRLCRYSPYFEAMFNRGFAEECLKQVSLKGVDPNAVDQLLAFVQADGCRSSVDLTMGNVFNLLQASDMFQFQDIHDMCTDFVLNSLNAYNCMQVLSESCLIGVPVLWNRSLQLSLWSFAKHWPDQQFLDLPSHLVNLLVSHQHLNVKQEFDVFLAINAWAEVDMESRKSQAIDMIENGLRLHTLNKSDIGDMQRYSVLVDQQHPVSLAENSILKRSPPTFPCCVGNVNKVPHLLLYDKEANDVTPYLLLSGKVLSGGIQASGFRVINVGPDVYIIGGEFTLGRSNWNRSVWRYSTLSCEWTHVLNLEVPRRHHSACSNESGIYLVGGFGKHRIILNTLEYLKCDGILEECAALKQPLYSPAVCMFQGRVYAIKDSVNVYAYDPEANEWSSDAFQNVEMPRAVEFNFALATQTCIYLTAKHSYELYCYKPTEANEMGCKKPLEVVGQFQCETQNMCIVDGVIYNFSSDQFDYSASVETYTEDTRTFKVEWTKADSNIDFSPYFSFGCFPLVKYPNYKL